MAKAIQELIEHSDFPEGSCWSRVPVGADEIIITEGEEGEDIYLVLKGHVRVVAQVELGEQRHIRPGFHELGPGELFGELALFDHGPRSASVIAISDCELARLPGSQLLDFLDHHPELGYWVLKEVIEDLVGRVRSTNRKLLALFAWGLKARGIDEHL